MQCNGEAGAALVCLVDRAVDGNLPIMLFDDGVDQCQSEPGTCPWFLGGEEGLEQTVLDFLVDAAALIFNLQQHLMLVFLTGNGDAVAALARVPRVAEQVDQHLYQALGIAGDQVLGCCCFQFSYLCVCDFPMRARFPLRASIFGCYFVSMY